nr:MAG TPA: hypothetical protein [Caudoviricetes sp.]
MLIFSAFLSPVCPPEWLRGTKFCPSKPLWGTNGGQKCGKNKQTRENMTLKTAYLISI